MDAAAHRPGYRFNDGYEFNDAESRAERDAERRAAHGEWLLACDRASNAWKMEKPKRDDDPDDNDDPYSKMHRRAKRGDDHPFDPAVDAQARKDAAYERMKEELQNAWKIPPSAANHIEMMRKQVTHEVP